MTIGSQNQKREWWGRNVACNRKTELHIHLYCSTIETTISDNGTFCSVWVPNSVCHNKLCVLQGCLVLPGVACCQICRSSEQRAQDTL